MTPSEPDLAARVDEAHPVSRRMYGSTTPDWRAGYQAAVEACHIINRPMTLWRGVCGHVWDRAVDDTPDCPRCGALVAANPRPDAGLREALERLVDVVEANAELVGDISIYGELNVAAEEAREALAAANPEPARDGPLPTVIPIPGFERVKSAWDLLSEDERRQLADQLDEMARTRRQGAGEAGRMPLP